MKNKIAVVAVLFLFGMMSVETLSAQPSELPARAITNVQLHQADGTVLSGASVVWRGGVIEAAGRNITIPFDARVIDGGDSLHVYPGFISGFTTWGSPSRAGNQGSADVPGHPSYERAGIQPDRVPENLLEDKSEFKAAIKNGFTTAAIGLEGFMLPGYVSIFHLAPSGVSSRLYSSQNAQLFQFEFARGAYPSTLMGVMARLRQLFYDTEAYAEHHQLFASRTSDSAISVPQSDAVLEALLPVKNRQIPFFINVDSEDDIDRILKLKDELNFNVVIVSGKEAAGSAEKLASAGIPVLVSLDIPEKPDWAKENGEDENENENEIEEEISDEQQHFRDRQLEAITDRWDNIRKLREAGVKTGFAAMDMKPVDIIKNIRILIEHGYLESDLIKIMTTETASILGHESRLGDIRPGMIANLAIFNGPVSDKDAKVVFTVSAGTFFDTEDIE